MNQHRLAQSARAFSLCATLAAAALTACGSATAPLAPFQPQITSAPDNFQFQATGVTNVTSTSTYPWSNSGTAASVNQATTVTAGSATVTILDQNGAQVYTKDLSANGTFPTSTGATGSWTIKVVLTNYSGTVNFRAQKM